MISLPSEYELKNYLRNIAKIKALPAWAELEPGAILYVIEKYWERDGRSGHLGEKQIASEISKIIGRKFTRNNYQSMFGSGRKTKVPQEVAKAFLSIAFKKWSYGHTDSNDGFHYIFPEKDETEHDVLINLITCLIYENDEPVICQPSEGLGPLGFYKQCRESDHVVIVAAEQEHITMDDPGQGLIDWNKSIYTYFANIDIQNSFLKHIWVFREPFISDEKDSMRGLYDIGLLRTAFMSARAMCLKGQMDLKWEQLSERCLVVMLMNSYNNSYRINNADIRPVLQNPIIEHFIFRKETPTMIVTIREKPEEDIGLDYNKIMDRDKRQPSLSPIISPGRESDQSVKNLYLCSKQYINSIHSEEMMKLLADAMSNGWKFMTADEFLDLKIP